MGDTLGYPEATTSLTDPTKQNLETGNPQVLNLSAPPARTPTGQTDLGVCIICIPYPAAQQGCAKVRTPWGPSSRDLPHGDPSLAGRDPMEPLDPMEFPLIP